MLQHMWQAVELQLLLGSAARPAGQRRTSLRRSLSFLCQSLRTCVSAGQIDGQMSSVLRWGGCDP